MLRRRSKKERQAAELAKLLVALDAAAGERRSLRSRRSARTSFGSARA